MQAKYTAKDIARFWGKIDKDHSNIFYNGTRCWEWTGNCNPDGYGNAWMGMKLRGAHRVAFELSFGEIQGGLWVLHRCDNPPCVNPSHLFLGTLQDNIDDRGRKGRTNIPSGEKNGRCKLSDEQVAEIRRRYAPYKRGSGSTVALAKEFGVSNQEISNIVNYKNRT